MGQLLVRMVRHRDSGGRDAQLRANLGIRELALAARRKKNKINEDRIKQKQTRGRSKKETFNQ